MPRRRIAPERTLARTLLAVAIGCPLGLFGSPRPACGAEPLRQVAGPYEATLLLPPAGLYAEEEMEIEFRVTYLDPSDAAKQRVPLRFASIQAEVDMPSMPGMPRFAAAAHREGIPGVWGVHPTFPHGGDYRLCLTVGPPELPSAGDTRPAEPSTFDFPLQVLDASASPRRESAKIRPFRLEVATTPSPPVAGEETDLGLTVRWAISYELREVVDFDVLHERLMHLFVVRDDLTHFAHEHPEPAGPGAFRLRYRFPAPGRYRIFVNFAPRNFGTQTLAAPIAVAGLAGRPAVPRAPALSTPVLAAEASGIRVQLELPDEGLPTGKTVTVTAILTDSKRRPVRDLQPWLGALGHLLLIHQDCETFAHAHPDERERSAGADGRIPFLVRLPQAGLYRAWLQFRRGGKVQTAELALEAGGAPSAAVIESGTGLVAPE